MADSSPSIIYSTSSNLPSSPSLSSHTPNLIDNTTTTAITSNTSTSHSSNTSHPDYQHTSLPTPLDSFLPLFPHIPTPPCDNSSHNPSPNLSNFTIPYPMNNSNINSPTSKHHNSLICPDILGLTNLDPKDIMTPLTTTKYPPSPASSFVSSLSSNKDFLEHAQLVLSSAAQALNDVCQLYRESELGQDSLVAAVEAILSSRAIGAKLVVCGVGKSGIIGRKLVATLKSLGIPCSWMHPIEALHGDLGDLNEGDTILFITFSGKTPELLSLVPHCPLSATIIVISGQTNPSSCLLLEKFRQRTQHPHSDMQLSSVIPYSPDSSAPNSPPSTPLTFKTILLPAPIPVPEETRFGVAAPTTSTTVAITVGDMLALACARRLHSSADPHGMRKVFLRNHPGGAIGNCS